MEITTKYLNEKQASKLTSIPLSTLRGHRHKGQGLPYCKAGKLVRYDLSDIKAYFENRKVRPGGGKA